MDLSIKIRRKLVFVLVAFSVLFAITSCSEDEDIWDFNAFSLEDDAALGKELDAQIKADPNEYPLLNNPNANKYLQDMVDAIIKSPDIKYSDAFDYKVQIINKNVINAFAAPGGYIYVYTGLIKFLDNEASMAAVLAHEIGHCENRHSTKRITKAYGVQFVLDILLGDNPDKLTELGAGILTNLALLKNSRDDEYEADESSFNYLMSSIWYPGATIFFFDKVKSDEGNAVFDVLFSTHPMPQDRIDAVKTLIKNAKLTDPYLVGDEKLFTQRYTAFKNSL